MSKVFINEETLIGIGNAIREKSGTTDLVNTTDMANAILNLPSGGGGTLKHARAIFTGTSNGSAKNPLTFDLSNIITYDQPFIFLLNAPGSNTVSSSNLIMYPLIGVSNRDGTFTIINNGGSTNTSATGYGISSILLDENCQLTLTKKSGNYFFPGSSSSKNFYLELFYLE